LAKNRSNINLSKISIESSVSFNLVESSKTHGGDKLFYIDTSKPFKSIRQK
jgi:hypothetical protein